ncbi:MAG: MerC domain-containing protein [Alphaproteobacteria bacterium]
MNNNNLIGITLSILCIIHCALPFLAIVTSLNSLAIFIENSKIIHIFLFTMVFVVYLIVFPKNYIRDRKLFTLIISSFGVLLLFFALFLDGYPETYSTLIGASLLLLAHYRNHISTNLIMDIKV